MKKEPIQVTPSWGNDKWSDPDSGTPVASATPCSLWRSNWEARDGKMELVQTSDLFVWACVNTKTGEVEMTEIQPYDDKLNENLVKGWEWRRFRLIETNSMNNAPTPKTAPQMHAAANESIEAVFRKGCDLERQLADVTKQRDRLEKALIETGVPLDPENDERICGDADARKQAGSLSPSDDATCSGVCRHCKRPIRFREYDQVWVHDDPDENPKNADYGWVSCGGDPDDAAEP